MPKITYTCIGCGACAGTAPNFFEIEDIGKSHFKVGDKDQTVEVKDSDLIDIRAAAEGCPVNAIHLSE
eukprot:MONOS_16812.1-p1 / transcript=MONOS_16812.1 / gene=MONOS_16812 / organism=Monocercomonoides_exilis_PA203 / gene_product=[4Fe-4S]ferredoxin / transcript_product=[4Fe-4S]ferredoxin / location=Mono_scaffold00068:87264-87751(+) / protein_length=68 / sequence_SO=supercontig / SO=protein_coding / is_pseudo=false